MSKGWKVSDINGENWVIVSAKSRNDAKQMHPAYGMDNWEFLDVRAVRFPAADGQPEGELSYRWCEACDTIKPSAAFGTSEWRCLECE